ncbi:MAG: ACP phosphodiesterase [Bacteroidales bacterium]|nr:ACP phosphodiesterase [Bacteroidales bacterium]
MNYLAHTYLSGENPEILIGNFMGDFVRGAEYLNFPDQIQEGIMLHRNIDWYTDSHPVTKECKKLFSPRYHKYAGVITDILFDHFLAKDWNIFHDKSLNDYTEWVYDILLSYFDVLPISAQKFLPGFFAGRWIEKYETIEGFREVLEKMSKQTSLPAESEWAKEILELNYDTLRFQFYDFFPGIIDYVQDKFRISIHRSE